MEYTPKILAFAGSLRKDSFNKKVLKLAVSGAEEAGAKVTVIDLNDYPLPILNQDDEAKNGLPQNALALKKLMDEHDGLMIASPEYNSSISGNLKNAIDWISRQATPSEPMLKSFNGKVAVIFSASVGGLGGLRGLVHLRAILNNINVLVIPQQETLPLASQAFNDQGVLLDEAKKSSFKSLGRILTETLFKLRKS